MAKESGLGVTTLAIDDSGGTVRDVKNDITTFNLDTPRATQDVTGLDKSASEKLHLLADFTFSCTGVFNDAANAFFDVVKSLANTRTVNIVHSGQTLANECLLTSVNWTRAASGEFTASVAASLQSGTVPAWA